MADCRKLLEFPRGATFTRAGALTRKDNGELVAPDFTGWGVPTCQLRQVDLAGNPAASIAALSCVWVNSATGLLSITNGDTSGWPLGLATLDLRFVTPGSEVIYTQRTLLKIVEPATHAP